jgi:predicted transcriptional regulator
LVVSRHTLVRDIMMPFVLTIPEESDIPHAAAVMASRSVHQLLVRREGGAIVAVVHARDVLAWFAKSRGLTIPADDDGEWRRNCLFAL